MSNEQITPSSPSFLQRVFSAVASPEFCRYGLFTVAPGALGAVALAAGVDPKVVVEAELIAAAAAAADEKNEDLLGRIAGGAGIGTLLGVAVIAFATHAYAPDFLKPKAATTTPAVPTSTFSVETKGLDCAGLRTGEPVELKNGDRHYVLTVPAGCQQRNP